MVARGADIPDEDLESVVEYLAKNFGPTKEPAAGEKDHDRNQPVNVNVNKASAAELGAELGLSPTEAAAIVAYREQNGNFKAWRELTNVPGIEATKIESNKDRLVF
jgi:competence protein ComEA